MRTIGTITEMKALVAGWRAEGLSVGLVPTMGALHEGHESLIDAARKACDKVVVSVFVNPTQFGPNEDFENYPRNLEHDQHICEAHNVDVIFHPAVQEMYPHGYSSYVIVEGLTDGLCGASRPGHFRGVCTVVTKLFNIIEPQMAFFGQKDAQQLAVIKRMVTDLNMNVRIVGCPIVRETDGLAKSSRNAYLSADERTAAVVLSRAIFAAQDALEGGERSSAAIRQIMRTIIETEPCARIDYIETVDGETLESVDTVPSSLLVAIAVYIGSTRLIDNLFFEVA